MRNICWMLLCLALFCEARFSFAQRDLQEIPVPNPELERKSFIVAEGFEVNLFAADPMLAKPIQMNFDAEGRLWVVSSSVYPHIKPGQKANDKVLILEDTNGDGKADKTKVFAEGLLIPTGVEPGDGGAYVANSTQLLHFSDTNGDGKADKKRVVLSGFGTEDTHHILHTFRWGYDARLYFNQSIYIHSHIETPWGVRRLGGGGIWRFRPESKKLEVFVRGFWNPWGHHFDRYGQSFATDGAYHEGINFLIPGASYAGAVKGTKLLKGLNPGNPKHCGLERLSGRHLPESWRGSFITNDFRGHRVCRFVPSGDGAGFASHQEQELIRTDHVAFRPIDVKMGPDGAIYIADWYNPIIQHGEVDFHDSRRDRTHGRIWRITAKGRPLVPKINLKKATPKELLDAMRLPEQWTRIHARREIKNREATAALAGKREQFLAAWKERLGDRMDAENVAAIRAMQKGEKEDVVMKGLEEFRMELVWTHQALDLRNFDLLDEMLESRDGKIRAAGVRVLADWRETYSNYEERLKELIEDKHPRVRLEVIRALGRSKKVEALKIALTAFEQKTDRFIDYGLWLTVRDLKPIWFPAFQKGALKFDGQPKQVLFVARAVGSPEMVEALIQIVQTTKLSGELRSQFLKEIGRLGNATQLQTVYKIVLAPRTSSKDAADLLNVLADAAESRRVRPQGDLSKIEAFLLLSREEKTQISALRCIGFWKLEPLAKSLVQIASNKENSNVLRTETIRSLAFLDSKIAKKGLKHLASSQFSTLTRRDAIVAIAKRHPRTAVLSIPAILKDWDVPTEQFAPLVEAFLQSRNGPSLLAKTLKGVRVKGQLAKVGLRQISSSGRAQPELTAAFTKAGGITFGPKKLTAEEMKKMVSDVLTLGDAHRGEAIFRRKSLSCLKCHSIGGVGGRVGTDISSLGGSSQVDYIIESVLDPAAKVKENYHSIVVITKRAKVYTGIKVKKTETELILRDAESREIKIPIADIMNESAGTSLMPAGLVDQLSKQELLDLIRFLSALGKDREFSVSLKQYVRAWENMIASKESSFRLRRTRHGMAATDDPTFQWKPFYAKVDAAVPYDELDLLATHLRIAKEKGGYSFLRCHLEVTTPGDVILKFKEINQMKAWLNDKPIELKRNTRISLSKGKQRLTFRIVRHSETRGKQLRMEVETIDSEKTRYRILGKR